MTEKQFTPEQHRIAAWHKKQAKELEGYVSKSRYGIIPILLAYNAILLSVFGYYNYVNQKNYRSFDTTQIDQRLAEYTSLDVCVSYDPPSFKNLVDKDIQKMFSHIDDKLEVKEGSSCNFHLKVKQDMPATLPSLTLLSDSEIQLETNPDLFGKTATYRMAKAIHAIAEDLLFMAPFGMKMFQPSKLTLPKFSGMNIDLYFNSEHLDTAEIEEATKQAEDMASSILVEKLGVLEQDQIIVSHKFIKASNPILVTKADSEAVLLNQTAMMELLQTQRAINAYSPESPERDQLKYGAIKQQITLALFISPGKGPKFAFVNPERSQAHSSMESLISTSFASAVELTRSDIQKIVTHSILKSAGVTSLKDLQSEFSGTLEIEERRAEQRRGIKQFKETQEKLQAIAAIQDYLAIIELLKINDLESTVEIYQGMNIHQLVEHLRDEISTSGVSAETLRKIGVLYQTKKMNPPFYFSWEFMVGTYIPFLSPFIMPLLQISLKEVKKAVWRKK